MFRLRLALTLCLLCLPAIASAQPSSQQSDLNALYKQKRFFELRDAVGRSDPKSTPGYAFYSGVVSNKFNKLDQAIAQLQDYLAGDAKGPDSELSAFAYGVLADSYVKTYRYREAADAYRTLVDRFRPKLSSASVRNTETSVSLWGALKDVPRQSVLIEDETRLHLTRDKAGLLRVPVRVADREAAFVFDTGANISCVTRTLATRLHLALLPGTIDVGAITGAMVKANLAVCPELRIGNVTARNVVFLVFADANLAFPSIHYTIDGIVGFPLISALKEIVLTREGELTIPVISTTQPDQNLCLDDLTPVVSGQYRDKRLDFTLDTGAVHSHLNAAFYKSYRSDVEKLATRETLKLGGAGGIKAVTTYKLPDVHLTLARKEVVFKTISVMKDETDENSHYFYGNLGQDVISQFSRMTINFDSMFVRFE